MTFVETPIRQLASGDLIQLRDGVGRILRIEARSHMPSIFEDCYGRDGRSVYWRNLDGPHAGKDGVERVHADTTVMAERCEQ